MLPILLIALIALTFLLLPFQGENRFFSMRVAPEWITGPQARSIRQIYSMTVVGSLLCAVATLHLAPRHPFLLWATPVCTVALLLAAWARGWRQTLPAAQKFPVLRAASLSRRQPWTVLGIYAALLPLLAAAVVLLLHYRALPASLPLHYNANGTPGRWVPRNGFTVLAPLGAGALAIAFLAELQRAVQRRGAGIADRGRYLALTGAFVTLIAWLLSVQCSWVGLLPLLPGAPHTALILVRYAAWTTTLALILSLVVLLPGSQLLGSAQGATDVAHWRAGILYFNPDDAALFVPKRLGLGWTLNMAQPAAWVLLALTLALALVPLLLRHFGA